MTTTSLFPDGIEYRFFWTGLRIHKGSVYENISEQDGIHLPTRDDNELLESLTVEEAVIKEPITLSAHLPIKDAFQKVRDSNISDFRF